MKVKNIISKFKILLNRKSFIIFIVSFLLLTFFILISILIFHKKQNLLIGTGKIISLTPPKNIIAPVDGSIIDFSVEDHKKVKSGEVLAIINTNIPENKADRNQELKNRKSAVLSSSLATGLPSSLPTISILPSLPGAPVPAEPRASKNFENNSLSEYKEALKDQKNKEIKFNSAQKQMDKYNELYIQGALSRNEIESFKTEYFKEKNSLELAKQNVVQLKNEINQQKHFVSHNSVSNFIEKPIKIKKINLSRLTKSQISFKKIIITAPCDGVVQISKVYNKGDHINKNSVLLSLEPLNPKIAAEVKVQGRNLSCIHLQQKVILINKDFPAKTTGLVESINLLNTDNKNGLSSYNIRIKPIIHVLKEKNGTIFVLKPNTNISANFLR